MLILSKKDIYRALDWPSAIEAVAGAFAALSTGRAAVPLRTFFEVPGQDGVMLLMPGALQSGADEAADQLAIKLVGIFQRNPARNMPLIYGLVTLFEAGSGRPLAVLDGLTVTAARTGAASGVATRLLAKPDPRRLALFGAGAQAETQLLAIGAACPSIREVRVVGRDPARARAFAGRMAALTGLSVEVAPDAAWALEGAEVVATATTSHTPVFEDSQLEPGAHINGVGSYNHAMREVPAATVARARLVVDAHEAALSEAGDLLIPLREGLFGEDHIYAELGEIVSGKKEGRAAFGPHEISFFKSVGNAAQDVALAAYLYKRARELGIGQEVEL